MFFRKYYVLTGLSQYRCDAFVWMQQKSLLDSCLRKWPPLPIQHTETIGKGGKLMNVMLEVDYTYQGITFDERMAIRHLFLSDDDVRTMTEQPPAGSMSEGAMQ